MTNSARTCNRERPELPVQTEWSDADKAMFQLAPMDHGVFEHLEVHRGMMGDSRVVSAYEAAIQKTVTKGTVVVDLGAGLGVLSLFAARSGAMIVYAVERNATIGLAQRIAKKSDVGGSIVFLRGCSTAVEVPRRAHVIVSQTLGHLGFEEDILRSVIDARRRFLAEGGNIIPATVELFLVPSESTQMDYALGFWTSQRFGLDFSDLREFAVNNIYVVDVRADDLLAKGAAPIYVADLRTVTSPSFSSELTMTAHRSGTVRGLAAWFRAHLADGIAIETAPEASRTHWRQCFLPISQPFAVDVGDRMVARIEMCSVSNGDPIWSWSIAPSGNDSAFGRCTRRLQSTAFAHY